MKKIIAAIILFWATTSQAQNIEGCALIPQDSVRLACFDALVPENNGNATVVPEVNPNDEETVDTGAWIIRSNVPALTDETNVL